MLRATFQHDGCGMVMLPTGMYEQTLTLHGGRAHVVAAVVFVHSLCAAQLVLTADLNSWGCVVCALTCTLDCYNHTVVAVVARLFLG